MSQSDKSGSRAGALVFAAAFLLFGLVLLSMIGVETDWSKKTKLAAQPRFWPAVALIGMVGFGLAHFLTTLSAFRRRDPATRVLDETWEMKIWSRAFEFVAWFMAYVLVVPVAGYLPTTMVFVPVLVYRLGYRGWRMIGAAVVTAVSIVVAFKTLLSVKIPGGTVYEALPDGLRSFVIIYF